MELEQPVTPDSTGTEEIQDNLDAELQTQQPEEEDVEEEYEGLKLRGRKEAIEEHKKGRMLQADYTRKTQELADQRRKDDSERESYTKNREAEQQLENEKFRFWSLNNRLQQLQQVNLQALRQTNPEQADALRDELVQLSAALPHLGQQLAQKVNERKSEAERTSATRANEAEQIVMREVKDWGPEKLAKFDESLQRAGMSPGAVRQLLIQFPEVSRALNKALMWDQHLIQRTQKPKAPEPPKPATRVGGSSAGNTKPLSEVTDPREWQTRRNQRLGRIT